MRFSAAFARVRLPGFALPDTRMTTKKAPKRDRPGRKAKAKSSAPHLYPLVHSGIPEPKFTQIQFNELEQAGGVSLSQEHRKDLETLARIWLVDLAGRQSPRPGDFGKRLHTLAMAIDQLLPLANLHSENPNSREYRLLVWALDCPAPGVPKLLSDLQGLEYYARATRETISQLIDHLPQDPGRARPFEDEKRMIELADIFEGAGGTAVIYASEHTQEGYMADTKFRRFAKRFYSLLPSNGKRNASGFESVLRNALSARPRRRRVRRPGDR